MYDSGITGEAPGPPGFYLGQLATRCVLPDTLFASTTGWNCRSTHYARDNITSLKVAFVNWRINTNVGEAGQGGTQTITASVEYPAGTFTQLLFSGSPSIVAADGSTTWTDFASIAIPNGAAFWIRRYQVNSVGVLFRNPFPQTNAAIGDAAENTTHVDQTMSGTITDNGSGGFLFPAAIVGITSRPSIAAIGSSRMQGAQDKTKDATGDTGYSRMFGNSFAYMNLAISSDSMRNAATTSPKRLALSQYCSHLWLDPGLNDFAANGSSEPIVEGYINTLAAAWPFLSRVLINDEGPLTTSTDLWTTPGGQTLPPYEASRRALNIFIDGKSTYNQVVRAADYDETGHNTGLWKSPGSGNPQFTPDGIHENSAICIALTASGIFNPALVHL